MRWRARVAALLATVAMLGAAQAPENPFAGDSAAIAEGRDLMGAVCGGYCHSTTETEANEAPDLFDCEWWHGDTDGDIFGVVRDGVPDTRMQGFGGMLADDDIWRLVAAIRADSRCDDPGAQAPVAR